MHGSSYIYAIGLGWFGIKTVLAQITRYILLFSHFYRICVFSVIFKLLYCYCCYTLVLFGCSYTLLLPVKASNSISRVNSEPESHPSPSQTESLDSNIPFNLQTMRFCLSQVVHKMASRKCRRSSWIFGLDFPVWFRFDLFRFACG